MAKKEALISDMDLNGAIQEKSGSLQEIVEREANESKAVEENESALVAVPIEVLPINLALPCSVYTKVGGKVCHFSQARRERLSCAGQVMSPQRKGVTSLYIHKAFWRLFTDSLKRLKLPEATSESEKNSHIRHLLAAYGEELERKAKEPKKPTF